MVSNLLNCLGAYCTMCVKSQSECQDPEVIKAGFVIERDVQGIKDLALSLTDPETGLITQRGREFVASQ